MSSVNSITARKTEDGMQSFYKLTDYPQTAFAVCFFVHFFGNVNDNGNANDKKDGEYVRPHKLFDNVKIYFL